MMTSRGDIISVWFLAYNVPPYSMKFEQVFERSIGDQLRELKPGKYAELYVAVCSTSIAVLCCDEDETHADKFGLAVFDIRPTPGRPDSDGFFHNITNYLRMPRVCACSLLSSPDSTKN
jgi:hypothetical protein